jgi:hypothetical protein
MRRHAAAGRIQAVRRALRSCSAVLPRGHDRRQRVVVDDDVLDVGHPPAARREVEGDPLLSPRNSTTESKPPTTRNVFLVVRRPSSEEAEAGCSGPGQVTSRPSG